MRALSISAAAAVGVFALTACANDSNQASADKILAPNQPSFTVQAQDRTPIVLTMNSCDNEVIPMAGTSHINVHETRDNAGGYHFLFEWNAHLEGTGSFGNNYLMNANEKQDVNNTSGGAQNMTLVFDERVISQGNHPNFVVGFLVHMTTNANGELTSQTFESRTKCDAG